MVVMVSMPVYVSCRSGDLGGYKLMVSNCQLLALFDSINLLMVDQ